jgi:hypothetical protein
MGREKRKVIYLFRRYRGWPANRNCGWREPRDRSRATRGGTGGAREEPMPRAEAGMLSGRVREVQIGGIGDVRANRMRGGRFPRVQRVGEPPGSTWREGRAIAQHES